MPDGLKQGLTMRCLLAGVATLGLCAASAPVWGQAAPATEAGLAIEEIIVTATKRTERLQDVPVAISVVSGDALTKAAVVNAENLVALVPSLTFRKGTTNVNSSLNLRGIGTISFSSAIEPSVSTVLDGVVLARSGQSFSDLFDIERIEVLRGPQGTLFGKNASAGVVNIVTKDPDNVAKGYVELGAFEGEEYRLRGSASGPVSEKVSYRIGGYFGSYDGNIRNVFNDKDVNGYERYGFRGMLKINASDALTFRLRADYAKNDDDCCADVITFADPNNAFIRQIFLSSNAPSIPGPKNRTVDHDLVTRTRDEISGTSVQADYDLGGASITSITAYRTWENREIREGDFRSDSPRFTNASVTAAGAGANNDRQLHDVGDVDFWQFTQELRLANYGKNLIDYVAGLYYYQTNQENDFTRNVLICQTAPAGTAAGPGGLVPCGPGSTFSNPTATANFEADLRNISAFGNATFNASDSLRLLAGARLTRDKVSYDFQRITALTGPAVGATFPNPGQILANGQPNVPIATSVRKTDFSWKLGGQYDLTEDAMAYVTYSDGYKGPGFNLFFNMSRPNTAPLRPEQVRAWEAGLKTSLFDNRMVLNAALFHAEYRGFHATNFALIEGAVVSTLVNVGKVRTKGGEAEFTLRATEDLTLNGGVQLAKADVLEAGCGPNDGPNCPLIQDTRLPLAPKWKGNVGFDYRLPFSDGLPFDVRLNGAMAYQSLQQFNLGPRNPLLVQDSYTTFDAGIILSDQDDRYQISLIGKNLTDRNFVSLKVQDGALIRSQIPRDADRYFGVNLRYNFGG
jgi:iron complex outermembrane recepter protein